MKLFISNKTVRFEEIKKYTIFVCHVTVDFNVNNILN